MEHETFWGYLFTSVNGWHHPKAYIESAQKAYEYCFANHVRYPEIRITDVGDFMVMRVINSVLYIPWPNEKFKVINLTTGVVSETSAPPLEIQPE